MYMFYAHRPEDYKVKDQVVPVTGGGVSDIHVHCTVVVTVFMSMGGGGVCLCSCVPSDH